MNKFSSCFGIIVFTTAFGWAPRAAAQNQTASLTPVNPTSTVPFSVQIQKALTLASGLQSFVVGTYQGKWLLFSGRINGLHGFNNSNNNFPPDQQNTTVFVIDPARQTVATRLLTDAQSGLTQPQVDLLSATGSQWCQSGTTLYLCGGYGYDTASSNYTTKDALTAVNIPGLMHWVTNPSPGETAAEHLSTVFNSIFQESGGVMMTGSSGTMLLAFGEDFEGAVTASSTGTYSGQVRHFSVRYANGTLSFAPLTAMPVTPDPSFDRTDLNIVPTIAHGEESYTALSGVFTPTDGVWTVPVQITTTGVPTMANPAIASTFKQGMNNFACPTLELYSAKSGSFYTVLMGGISYGFFQGTTFETDPELPFINEVTTITRNSLGVYSQCLMNSGYPVIASTGSNPGNTLLFGAGATFIPVAGLPSYSNGVLQLDALAAAGQPVDHHKGSSSFLVGYIVGGIQSTLPNTNTESDSSASPYVFSVTLVPGNP